ncbi:hypothetical protein [Kitasatospora sp. P5_F3]
MTIWVVRAGETGERAQFAFANQITTLSFREIGDLTATTREAAITALMEKPRLDSGKLYTYRAAVNVVSQLSSFIDNVAGRDQIVMPINGNHAFAFGTITGPFVYRPDFEENRRQTRATDWFGEEVTRAELAPDLRTALGSQLSIYQPKMADAQYRLAQLAAGSPDPGPRTRQV